MSLPEKPWTDGDTFTNDETGVEYTFDGEKWLASGGGEADDATLALINEVDRTSQMRDEILDDKIEEWDVLNTAVHLRMEQQIIRVDSWSTEGDEKLQAQIDNIADALPESPDNSLSIDIGEQVVKITGSRPVGGAGEEGKALIWKAESGGPATPYNECKIVVPDVDVIDLELNSIWFKQGGKVQEWYMGDPGWITNGNVVHYSALSAFGDNLIDGAPVELWYEDPRKAPAEYLEVITKEESKADDRHLQAEIDQVALALETLLVQREHGQWKYVGFTGDNIPRNAGEFSLASDDLSANNNIITINQEDLEGTTHGFGDVEVGDYVEIVDLGEPANYVLFVATKAPEGSGIVNVEVSLKDKGQNILIGATCEIRFFQVNEQDLQLEDLDRRYLKKTGGDNMEGPLHVKGHSGDSRGTSRIKTLGVFSESGSALRLGTTTDRVYIEDENTKFNGGVLVNNIGPKTEDGRGVTLNVEGSSDKHLVTKKYVDTAVGNIEIPETDLSDYLPLDGSTAMTGTLTVPRFEAKDSDKEAVCLIAGKASGTATASRLTFSNTGYQNAYGNLEWHGQNDSGWFSFNKDVDFSTHGLHSVNRIRLTGDKAIQEDASDRIKLNGRVIVTRTGDGKDGFSLKGRTAEGNNGDLLSAYHNSSGLDAINYRGKQDSPDNLATCGYVDSKAGASKGALINHMERLWKKGNGADGKTFYFQNQNGSPSSSMNDFRKFKWKLPDSHYLMPMVSAGRNMGYVVITNMSGQLQYQCQVSNSEKTGNYITLELDHENRYGSNMMGDDSYYIVHLFSFLREA
jgi:hypothetical protein